MGLLVGSVVAAQRKEGVVVYDTRQNMHRTITPEMKAMFPEFKEGRRMLLFTDRESIYKDMSSETAPDPFGSGGGRVVMNLDGTSETYIHFGEARKVIAKEMLGARFLVVDSLTKYPWVLMDESRTIAGHVCKKATLTTKMVRQTMRMEASTAKKSSAPPPKVEEIGIEAWYAVDLTSSGGPEGYTGLPGVILEMDIDKGAMVYKAREVRPLSDPKQIKEPKKGRKVTPEEYVSAVKEMLQNGMGGFQVKPVQ